jgi:hypothetical protein
MAQRKGPPPGYITATEAMELLDNKMLYKYVEKGLITQHGTEISKHKYYLRKEVQSVRDTLQAFYGEQEETPTKLSDKLKGHSLQFAQATPDDMEGVYAVASKLFEHTTSADARKPLVARCPIGNYIVGDNGAIVAYIHIQPLKREKLIAFMNGEIRGWQITADDLDCFAPGKTVEVLIKSIGSYHEDNAIRLVYMQRLLNGVSREIGEMGKQGIIIPTIYATSDTPTGIAMSLHAKMQPLGKMKHSDGKRFAFKLDVAASDLPLLRPYKQAIAQYRRSHSQETAQPVKHQRSTLWSQERITANESVQSGMPDGLIPLATFFDRHGISESTARRGIDKQFKIAPGGPWTLNGFRIIQALDAAGQRAFYEAYHSKASFTPCPSCPHVNQSPATSVPDPELGTQPQGE